MPRAWGVSFRAVILVVAVAAMFAAVPAMATAPRLDVGISTDADVRLQLVSSRRSEATAICGGDWAPQSVEPSSSRSGCFQQEGLLHVDAETEFAYKINDSKYVVWGFSKVPLVGKNELRCEIRPTGSDSNTTASPYGVTCEFKETSPQSYNPQPRFTVFRKPTTEVTDRARAIELLYGNCTGGQPHCSFVASSQKVLPAPQSTWQLWGAAQANCISKPTEPHTIGDSHTIAWTDTIGIKASGKFDVKVVEVAVEASYQHAITDSYTYTESHTQNIPYGRVGAFYLQPGYVEITGDFLISTAKENLSIKNITFDLPLGEDFHPQGGGPAVKKVVVHSMDIGDAGCTSDGPMALRSLAAGSPPPPGAVVMGESQERR